MRYFIFLLLSIILNIMAIHFRMTETHYSMVDDNKEVARTDTCEVID